MRSLLALLLAVVVCSASFQASAASRERLSGASQIEREIRWSWKYLKDIAASCLVSKTECQDPEVRKVVGELNDYLVDYETVEATQWSKLLSFVSEKDHPGVFTSDQGEAHRLAITEFKRHSIVMINSDLLARPLKEWVGVLAHEAVHHLGYTDDQNRVPDKVGAQLSLHFQKRALESDLARFNRPDARSLIFNSSGSRLAAGFFSSEEGTFDIEWGSLPIAPLCGPGETVTREFVGNPVWHINYLNPKTGKVTLRGGGFVNVMCASPSGFEQRRQALLGASLELQYSLPLDLENWMSEVPKVYLPNAQLGPSVSPPDVMWGPNQSFWVQALEHESSAMKAGDVWKTKVIVKSMDGHVPQTCEIYLSGVHWPNLKHISLPAVDIFNNCKMTALGNDRYQLESSYQLPKDMQPDHFFIPLIRFPGVSPDQGDRYATPRTTSFVKVENSQAQIPATLVSVQPLNLSPATSVSGIALKESYKVRDGDLFTLEVLVRGHQQVSDIQVDMPMWVPHSNGLANIFLNGPIADFPMIFEKTTIIKVEGGSKVLIQVRMPAEVAGYPVVALKFARVYLKTSDFAWAELEDEREDVGMIVNSRYAN